MAGTVRWVCAHRRAGADRLKPDIGGTPDVIRLNLLADTWRVPPDTTRAFLEGLENASLALLPEDLTVKPFVDAAGL
jgi:hypothetical protein